MKFDFVKNNKLLISFLAVYLVFLLFNVRPDYLDADEGSHAMTAVFYNKLFNDLLAKPTLNPLKLYDYA